MLTEGALRLNRNRSRERKKWCCTIPGTNASGSPKALFRLLVRLIRPCEVRVAKCKTELAFHDSHLAPRNTCRGHTLRSRRQALSQTANTSENGAPICEPKAGCRVRRARLALGLLMPQRKRASCRGVVRA